MFINGIEKQTRPVISRFVAFPAWSYFLCSIYIATTLILDLFKYNYQLFISFQMKSSALWLWDRMSCSERRIPISFLDVTNHQWQQEVSLFCLNFLLSFIFCNWCLGFVQGLVKFSLLLFEPSTSIDGNWSICVSNISYP